LSRSETNAGAARGPAQQFLGSLFFTCFWFAWTFLYAIPFVFVCFFLPFAGRFALARAYAVVVLWVLKWSCGLTYRIEGTPLPPGSHVALWKHSSSWETMAMMVVFPRQVWVLKRELLWIPMVGLAVRQMHAIAIDRRAGHSAVAQVVEQGKQRLDEGAWVMIYPEGTRMPRGETRRYGVSGTLLAIESGRLIVPVAHNAVLLAAARTAQETRRGAGGDRSTLRRRGPRSARPQRRDPGVGGGHRQQLGSFGSS